MGDIMTEEEEIANLATLTPRELSIVHATKLVYIERHLKGINGKVAEFDAWKTKQQALTNKVIGAYGLLMLGLVIYNAWPK